MKLYIKYDNKPPYLPVAVADSERELAKILGISLNNVKSSYSHRRSTFAVAEIGKERYQHEENGF